jgi:hypothetical protein
MTRGGLPAVWLLVSLLPSPAAHAQAWVRAAGEGAVTVATQVIDNTGHILTDGSTQPLGKSRSAAIYVEFDYGISDRVSVTAGVPVVFVRYLGPRPPAGVPEPPMVQEVDRCYCWHQGLQDFGFSARYNLLGGPASVTPSIAVGVPSHGYDYIGEAVVGRRLLEMRLAVDAGARLDSISPRLTVQGRYSYAIVEQFLEVPNNRSNVAAEVAFRLTDALTVQGNVLRQVTHGGLRAGTQGPTPPNGYPWGEITTEELFQQHDRLMRDNHWRLGGGVSLSCARADLFVSYLEFVAGSDTHAGRAITLGFSVPFELPSRRARLGPS